MLCPKVDRLGGQNWIGSSPGQAAPTGQYWAVHVFWLPMSVCLNASTSWRKHSGVRPAQCCLLLSPPTPMVQEMGGVVGIIKVPKDVHILVPKICKCYFRWQKGIKVASGNKIAYQLTLN